MRRKRSTIYAYQWLRLVRGIDRKGLPYFDVEFYRTGNRKFTRKVANNEKDALKIWSELTKELPQIMDELERERWLLARIVPPPKRAAVRSHELALNFGKTKLARDLERYCEGYLARPVQRDTKAKIVKACRDLIAHAGGLGNLTKGAVEAMFKARMRPGNHDSPETLHSLKTDVKAIAKWLGVRDVNGLFRDIYIPTPAQLRGAGIGYKTRNRQHLERDQVIELIRALLRDDSSETSAERSAIFIQLPFGFRPQEATCAELLPNSIFVGGSWKNGRKAPLKTASNGVQAITVKRTPVLDAYLFVTGCIPAPVPTKKAHSYFQQMARTALGETYGHLDRYCLRHTALTWLCRDKSFTAREVADMCGHASMRMLDDYYAHRSVKDKREWRNAMPLNISGVPQSWHGFLLEVVMAIKWPCLCDGKIPVGDPAYERVVQFLRSAKSERPHLVLF